MSRKGCEQEFKQAQLHSILSISVKLIAPGSRLNPPRTRHTGEPSQEPFSYDEERGKRRVCVTGGRSISVKRILQPSDMLV